VTANAKFAASIREGVHIWNINGFAEEFLRKLPEYEREFFASIQACDDEARGRFRVAAGDLLELI
jgi:hypothetical protein